MPMVGVVTRFTSAALTSGPRPGSFFLGTYNWRKTLLVQAKSDKEPELSTVTLVPYARPSGEQLTSKCKFREYTDDACFFFDFGKK